QPSIGLADLLALQDGHGPSLVCLGGLSHPAGQHERAACERRRRNHLLHPVLDLDDDVRLPEGGVRCARRELHAVWSTNEIEPVVPRQMTDSVAFATAL